MPTADSLSSTFLSSDSPAPEFPQSGSFREKLAFLLRYAVLAPSSHNTQPWRFRIGPDRIDLYADPDRWLKVADADQRELFVSLGCALENLLIAAEHHGFGHETTYRAQAPVSEPPENRDPAVVVTLTEAGSPSTHRSGLADAIPRRRTHREVYRDEPLSDADLGRLQGCVVETDVDLLLTRDAHLTQQVERLITEANDRQFADPAWRRELGTWVGKGLLGTSWLVSKVSQLAVTHLDLSTSTNRDDSERLWSAAALGVVTTSENTRRNQIRAGQVLERVWLRATAEGWSLHPMNQALQIPALKEKVRALLPAPAATPQIIFRLGRGDDTPSPPPRWSVDDVLLPSPA